AGGRDGAVDGAPHGRRHAAAAGLQPGLHVDLRAAVGDDALTIHRTRGEALHHPAVDEHVERDHGHRRDDRRRHELAPVEDVAVDQQIQTHRHRERPLVLDEDQRVQELVPRQREGEDRGGDDARRGQRQQHAHERLDPRGAVHQRGLLQLRGERLEEPDEQPRAERNRERGVGEEQRHQRVRRAQLGEHPVEWDEEQRELVASLILIVYLVPPALLFIPLYRVLAELGTTNSLMSLFLSYPTFTVPFCTWLLIGFFKALPTELEEAALVDGATRIQALVRVLLPLAAPGIVASAIFAFTLSWNEFLYALVFIQDERTLTVPVGLNLLIYGDVFHWGQLMAASVITTVPVVALYMFIHRWVVDVDAPGRQLEPARAPRVQTRSVVGAHAADEPALAIVVRVHRPAMATRQHRHRAVVGRRVVEKQPHGEHVVVGVRIERGVLM